MAAAAWPPWPPKPPLPGRCRAELGRSVGRRHGRTATPRRAHAAGPETPRSPVPPRERRRRRVPRSPPPARRSPHGATAHDRRVAGPTAARPRQEGCCGCLPAKPCNYATVLLWRRNCTALLLLLLLYYYCVEVELLLPAVVAAAAAGRAPPAARRPTAAATGRPVANGRPAALRTALIATAAVAAAMPLLRRAALRLEWVPP